MLVTSAPSWGSFMRPRLMPTWTLEASSRQSHFTAWTWRRRTSANCAMPSGQRVSYQRCKNRAVERFIFLIELMLATNYFNRTLPCYPIDAYYCHMGTAIMHHVPDRVKWSFVVFDIWALWRSGLSIRVHGCQKLQMTYSLTRSGTWCFIAIPYGNNGRQRVN